MKKIAFSILITLIIVLSSNSQTKNYNQLDSAGKKHGKWVVYLNQYWKKVTDSSAASYFRYTYYDHGVNIYPMGPCGKKGYRLESNLKQSNQLNLLDGEYKWYDSKGRLSSIHVFKNGEYISCKEFYTSGELNQLFDYTKKCENSEHGWQVSVYDKKGTVKLTSMTCKDKNNQWPKMRD